MTAVGSSVAASAVSRLVSPIPNAIKKKPKWPRALAHGFLMVIAVTWLLPLFWAFYTSLRTESDTTTHGYFSVAKQLTMKNYSSVWKDGRILHFFQNTMLITLPAVLITLVLSSMVAFTATRLSSRFNLMMLVLFTAGNLLPQQVLVLPLFQMFKRMWAPWFLSDGGHVLNSSFGLILIHVAFQTGFCTFVLSNYMKTIPGDLSEAAMVDGANIWTQFRTVIMPLCRPALAALGTLQFTWVYNDFFWAAVFIPSGDKRPITSAIANLQGQFAANYNLVAAASILIAVPTLVVYAALQKQFISGLTLGASKG